MARSLCPDLGTLKLLLKYLYKKGLIGCYDDAGSEAEIISKIQLTDEGFSCVIGSNAYVALNNGLSIPLTVNVASVVV